MTSQVRLFVLCVSAPIIAYAVVGGFLGKALARDGSTYQHLRVFEDVVSLILSNYVEEAKVDKVMHGAMQGLAEGLDPDSAYLSPEQVRSLERSGQPPADVGLELTRQYYLRIIAARDDSPAARAGLRLGDMVRAIDDQSTRDLSVFEGLRRLRGTPGSTVVLTIIRGNAADPYRVELVRERALAPDVSGRIAAPGVGYVRVAAFGAQVSAALESQVRKLTGAGATRLVVDVRSTAAGTLDAGVAAARLFVPSGILTMREARGGAREIVNASPGDGAVRLPAAVLVDGGTSGAAELFAAALAGNQRAELIGGRTQGRVAIQTLVKLSDGSGLWLSTRRYLTPAGVPIHEKGLEPSVKVDLPEPEFGAPPPSSDLILDKALERLALKPAA